MRCDRTRAWEALLLGAAALCLSSSGLAEKSKVIGVPSQWQKGRVLTSTGRERYRLAAGTSVAVAPNAALEVKSNVTLPASPDGPAPSAFAAQLTQGRIDIAIDSKQKRANAVFIYGPRRATVLVRAGTVSVIAGPSSLAVGVYAGKDSASVGIGSSWRHISAGNSLSISPDAPQGIESKLPVAPSQVKATCPAIAIDGGASAARAEWLPVHGAKRYLLQLVNLETKLARSLQVTEPSMALRGLEAGRHELRVSAVDTTGLEGQSSEPILVNVVGLRLPPGAFVSQGKVFLESTQQITLTNVDGLEATYDSAQVYFKAVPRVGLRGERPTTLHLRLPGERLRVPLELLPRDLNAQVEISPARARWPRDKVVVRILLPTRLSRESSIQVVPSVTVNGKVLALEWVRTDQTLETVIPTAPVYPGPWVVRAEVFDQHGMMLGRNFLEIASTAGLDDEDIPLEIHRVPLTLQVNRHENR